MKKAFIIILVILILSVSVGVAVFNISVDPFGIFGIPSLDWYSYENIDDFILAKLAYLDEHHTEYDSYIIGSSAAAAYDIDTLNMYFDADFYNLYIQGSNAVEYYALSAIAVEHFNAKNIVLNLDTFEPAAYNKSENPLITHSDALYIKSSPAKFFVRYAFEHPRYGIAKKSTSFIVSDIADYSSILPETGGIDYSKRDEEKIGSLSSYEEKYNQEFRVVGTSANLPSVISTVDCVKRIKDLCDRNGTKLTVILSPVYHKQWSLYDRDQLTAYKKELARVVNYWDFSNTSLSYDSRYFYDKHHFRADVSKMMLAEIFDDSDVYKATDFGTFVTEGTFNSYIEDILSQKSAISDIDLPILMYHHFGDAVTNYMVVTPKTFEEHLKTLYDAGYSTIDFSDLVAYVYNGKPLPEKPIILTFDDGYTSNYEIAKPILEKYGMKATVFAIGSSIGKSTYKDTEHSIIPHFNLDQAAEMLSGDTIQIESHTFDMHQWADYEEKEPVRGTILPFDGEAEEEYTTALLKDIETYSRLWNDKFGKKFYALAYPGGQFNELSEKIIHKSGIPVTLTTSTDTRNTILQGLPQSLYALSRWNITEKTTADKILEIVNN